MRRELRHKITHWLFIIMVLSAVIFFLIFFLLALFSPEKYLDEKTEFRQKYDMDYLSHNKCVFIIGDDYYEKRIHEFKGKIYWRGVTDEQQD